MQKENLLKTLKKFEHPYESDRTLSDIDKQTIENDLNRTDFGFSNSRRNIKKLKLFLYILQKSFAEPPIQYFQGMMEIATVLIDAYFGGIEVGTDTDENSTIYVKVNDITDAEKQEFDVILENNKELFQKYQNSLANILEDKFLYLTKNDFQKYNLLNSKFITMVNFMKTTMFKSYNIKLEKSNSFKYMNHTLSFFKRLSANSEVIFTIFNLILNSDHGMIFCILAFYLKKADEFSGNNAILSENERSKLLISEISETDIKKILKIHDTFLKEKYKRAHWSFLEKHTNLGIFLGMILLAFAIALLNK